MMTELTIAKDYIETLTSVSVDVSSSPAALLQQLCTVPVIGYIASEADMNQLRNQLRRLESGYIYEWTNFCQIHYMLFPLTGLQEFVVLGPFLPEALTEQSMQALLAKNRISSSYMSYLPLYCITIPICSPHIIFQSASVLYRHLGLGRTPVLQLLSWEPTSEFHLEKNPKMHLLETRYEYENRMLTAIQNGDDTSAVEAFKPLSRDTSRLIRQKEPLRNAKNLSFVLNTLCRKAAEQGGVHPVHIDILSEEYAVRIENAPTQGRVKELQLEIILGYCQLVRRFGLRRYTPTIRTIIDYIHIHLSESLTLPEIAEQTGLSPNYVSSLFKQQTGKSIVNYIHEVRAQTAAGLLRRTAIPTQDIAGYVGFDNVNYFSKVFKSLYHCTPTAYREGAPSERAEKNAMPSD